MESCFLIQRRGTIRANYPDEDILNKIEIDVNGKVVWRKPISDENIKFQHLPK